MLVADFAVDSETVAEVVDAVEVVDAAEGADVEEKMKRSRGLQ